MECHLYAKPTQDISFLNKFLRYKNKKNEV